MGRVWSEETAQSAEDFNDAITRLKATGDGFFQTAAQFYIPVMADVVGGMALMARAAVTMTWPWERGGIEGHRGPSGQGAVPEARVEGVRRQR